MEALPRSTVFMGVPTYYQSLAHQVRLPERSAVRIGIRAAVSGRAPGFRTTDGPSHLERYGTTEAMILVDGGKLRYELSERAKAVFAHWDKPDQTRDANLQSAAFLAPAIWELGFVEETLPRRQFVRQDRLIGQRIIAVTRRASKPRTRRRCLVILAF
jgi:hypothetical protein